MSRLFVLAIVFSAAITGCADSIQRDSIPSETVPKKGQGADVPTRPQAADAPPMNCDDRGSCPANLQSLDWYLYNASARNLSVYRMHLEKVREAREPYSPSPGVTYIFDTVEAEVVVDKVYMGDVRPGSTSIKYTKAGCYDPQVDKEAGEAFAAKQCFEAFQKKDVTSGADFVVISAGPNHEAFQTYSFTGKSIPARDANTTASVTEAELNAKIGAARLANGK